MEAGKREEGRGTREEGRRTGTRTARGREEEGTFVKNSQLNVTLDDIEVNLQVHVG